MPIGLSAAMLSNVDPGTVLPDLFQGTEAGNFGWLTWAGSPSEPTLLRSLRSPGDSATFINPDDPRDHQISHGDWVRGRPGVSNSRGVRRALEGLRSQSIVVPVWDTARGMGDGMAYRIHGFAAVEILNFRLPNQNQITARFLGFITCPDENSPPVVNAGPDLTNAAPTTLYLIGEVSDDGLPPGAPLAESWSVVTGPGEVVFENDVGPVTSATFTVPGAYVLRLTVSDSVLSSSDDVLIVLNSLNRPPLATPVSLEIDEDELIEFELVADDPDGDLLDFTIIEAPVYGSLEGVPPTLRFFPPQDFHGTNTLVSSVSDGLYTVAVTNTIIVRPVNDHPVADPQWLQLPEDEVTPIELSGSDVEGGLIGFSIVTSPAHGVLDPTPLAHRFLYKPLTNFHGFDSFTFVASDGVLLSAPQAVVFTVTNVNDAPLVNSGADVSVNLPSNTVSLVGIVQDDEFSEYLEVFWTQVSGPAPAAIAETNVTDTIVSFGVSGMYVFRLTADDGLFIGADDVVITVNGVPVVHAGVDFTNTHPAVVTLRGAVLDDGLPGDSGLSVRWRKAFGPGAVVFSDPGVTNATVSFGASGLYTLELVADDGWSSATGRVQALANRAPLVDAGQDQTNRQDEVTFLTATVSDDGISGDAGLTVTWESGGGPGEVHFGDRHATNTTAMFSLPGLYAVSVVASDSLSTNRDEKIVTVLVPNAAPVIATMESQVVYLPEVASLVAMVEDDGIHGSEGLRARWRWVSGPATPVFSDPFSLSTTVLFSMPGNYILELTADDGIATNSVEVILAVREPALNEAPMVSAGSDKAIGLTDTLTLCGTVMDDHLPRGAVVAAEWSRVSGPGLVGFSDASRTNSRAYFTEAGTYLLRLTVSDSEFSASDDVVLTVYSRNHPPMVNAGPDQVLLVPDPAVFPANATVPIVPGLELSRAVGAVAHWNNAIGQPGLTGIPKGSGSVRGWVNGLAVSGSNLFASGLFTHAGDKLVKGVARWNGFEWFPLHDSRPDSLTNVVAPSVGLIADMVESVGPIAARGEDLFVGGANLDNLPDSDDLALDNTALWDGVQWLAWNYMTAPSDLGDVLDVAVSSESVYVAGWFAIQSESDPGQPSPGVSHRIARWDGNRWLGLGSQGLTDIRGQSFAGARALAVGRNGVVFLGGEFVMATPTGIASNVVKWNGAAWEPLGLGISGCSRISCKTVIHSMTVADDGSLFVVGDFAFAGGVPANDVARWDGTNWTALAAETGNGVDGEATAVAVRGSDVFVGGNFGSAGGFDTRNIARWNGRFWVPMGIGSTNGTLGPVLALAADHTGVYVSGDFSSAGGLPAGEIAKWEFPPAPPVEAQLAGSAVDDGLPAGAGLVFAWTKISGPGDVVFADSTLPSTTARFGAAGNYVLRLSANDSELEAFDDVSIEVQVNRPPEVHVSPTGATVGVNESLALRAAVGDDGLPANVSVVHAWAVVSAPANAIVTFENISATNTSVQFDRVGAYLLRLTANDTQFNTSIEIPVTVQGANTPPAANLASYTSSVTLPNAGFAQAAVADTAGRPAGVTNVLWTVVSGPAPVAFSDASGVETSLYFTNPGQYILRLLASDTELTASADFPVTVTGPVQPGFAGNLPPMANAGPDRTVFARSPFILIGNASDDGIPTGSRVITAWSASNSVDRVYFDDTRQPVTTAVINTPGVYVLRFVATDGQLVANDEVVVTVVAPTNQPPVVSAGSDIAVRRPASAHLLGSALDDELPFSAPLVSAWFKVSGPGAVHFNPSAVTNAVPETRATFDLPGIYQLRLTVTDGDFVQFDDVTVVVEEGVNTPPVVDAGLDAGAALSGVAVLGGTAIDDGLPTGRLQFNWSQVSGPGFATFSTLNNVWRASFSAPGIYVLRLTASDGALTVDDDVTVTVYDAPDAPTVMLLLPAEGDLITTLATVTGVVSSGVLQNWIVQYRLKPVENNSEPPGNETAYEWQILATGTNQVGGGPLASFDPTLLLNGIYELSLTATDVLGRTSSSEPVTVIVDRRLKLGHFTVSFNDLTIPVAGIPIQVTRTYDSRNKGLGDFGKGWTLDLKSIRLQKSRHLGRGWDQISSGGLLPTYCIQTIKPRVVTITFPDGKVQKFRGVPVNLQTGSDCQALVPLEYPTMIFEPIGGDTRGTLVPLFEVNGEIVPDDQLVFGAFAGIPGRGDLISFERLLNPPAGAADNLLFDPDLFEFTSLEGFRYVLSETNGLRSVTDPHGNTLTVTSHGITWTNASSGGDGLAVQFQRDASHRITNIVDALGQSMSYAYDAGGDLRTFIDRDGHTNSFTYDGHHNLLTLSNGAGVPSLANDYDEAGRLLGSVDAAGYRMSYAYDLPNQRTFITNRLGFVTMNEFDTRGNVVRTVNPLGAATSFTYDENDNLLSTSNANDCDCGKIYTYDAQDNRVTETDGRGHSTRFAHNQLRKALTMTEPAGFATTNTYDTHGNLLSTRDSAGQVARFEYNNLGKVTRMIDPLGHETRLAYNEWGMLTNEINALGHATAYEVDANGNRLNQTVIWSQASALGLARAHSRSLGWMEASAAPVPVSTSTQTNQFRLVMRHEYSPSGQPVRTLYYDGSASEITYTAAGKKRCVEDPGGLATCYQYTASGQIEEVAYPNGCRERFQYDAEGHLIVSTDRRGFETRYSYDPNGQLVHTRFADGSEIRASYYADGSLHTETARNGEVTRYGIDPDGNRTSVSNSVGIARYEYNYRKFVTAKVDPLGRTNRYEYDVIGRNTTVVYPDASTKLASYSGKLLTSETEQAGRTTSYGYDALGRLTSVTNAAGEVTSFAYDETGNKISEVDPLGQGTFFEYDTMRRLVRIAHPDGTSQSTEYDAKGRAVARVDQDGQVTWFGYDSTDNLIVMTNALGGVTRFDYDCGGNKVFQQDPDEKVTRFEYDPLNRLTRVILPCGAEETTSYDLAGRAIARTDAAGRITRFEYDLRNNLIRVTEPGDRVRSFVYDAVGNRTVETDPAGQITTLEYDSVERRVRTVFPDGTVQRVEYDPVGRVTRQIDPAGKTSTFQYDSLGRLTDVIDPLGHVTSLGYDAAGRRIAETNANGMVTRFQHDAMGRRTVTFRADGSTTVLAYDRVGRVASETDPLGQTTLFAYDAMGRLTGHQDALGNVTQISLDPVGRVKSQTDALGQTSHFEYDCLGRRTGVVLPDGSRRSAEYDALGRPLIQTDANTNSIRLAYDAFGNLVAATNALGHVTRFDYDPLNRMVASTDALGRITTFEYDPLGRRTRSIFPDGAVESTGYDAKGRRVRETNPAGHSTFFAYDDSDRLIAITNALGQVTRFEYDAAGRLLAQTDALGHTTSFEYDSLDRRTRAIYADQSFHRTLFDALGRRVAETDPAGKITTFSHDKLGRLTGVTNAMGESTHYGYDSMGRLVAQTNGNGHVTTFAYDPVGRRVRRTLPGGQTERFGYDPGGNLVARTNFNGLVVTYEYDPLNRLTARIPDAALQGAGSVPARYDYDAVGMRVRMSDGSGTTAYTYDVRDRLLTKTIQWARFPVPTVLSYRHDTNGNLAGIQSSNPNGSHVAYASDELNRLNVVQDDRIGTATYGYDPVGNLQRASRPNGWTNTFAYDVLHRLTNVALTRAAQPAGNYGFTLGPAGHRQGSTEILRTASGDVAAHRSFGYDDAWRLTTEVLQTGESALPLAVEYGYDAAGNRTRVDSTLPAIAPATHRYTSNDWLIGDAYDANGNTTNAFVHVPLIGRTNAVFDQFDFEDRLFERQTSTESGLSTIHLQYDGDGNCVAKTIVTGTNMVTTLFVVDDHNPTGYAQVLEELTSSNGGGFAVTRVLTWGRELIAQDQFAGDQWKVSYPGNDGAGNIRFLTDAGGAVTDSFDYDAFGNLIARTGTTPSDYLFGGQQFDWDLNLYYFRARHHNPATGRFWTPDSFEGFLDQPASLHRYAFNQNDPVNRVDPSGHVSLGESLQVSGLAPLVRGAFLSLWDGVNNYAYGMAGGNTLKFTNREEAYFIDSLAIGPGWKFGKPNFWAAAQGAPFLLALNPNIWQSAKPCGYRCIPFDLDVPVYGPDAGHPIFELQPSELYQYLEAPGEFVRGLTGNIAESVTGIVQLGTDILGSAGYAATFALTQDLEAAELLFGPQLKELNQMVSGAYRLGVHAAGASVYWHLRPFAPALASEFFGDHAQALKGDLEQLWQASTGGEGEWDVYRTGYTVANFSPLLLGKLGKVRALGTMEGLNSFRQATGALKTAARARQTVEASTALLTGAERVCRKSVHELPTAGRSFVEGMGRRWEAPSGRSGAEPSFDLPTALDGIQNSTRKGPVIIGETMARVEAVAAKMPGAKTLNDMPDFRAMGMTDYEVTGAMMQFNRKWILEQIRSGRQIIDIGLDPNRAIPSIFYQMEQIMFESYRKLHPEFNGVTLP